MKKKEQIICDQVLDSLDGGVRREVIVDIRYGRPFCWDLNCFLFTFPKNLLINDNVYRVDVFKSTILESAQSIRLQGNSWLKGTQVIEVEHWHPYPKRIKKLTTKQMTQLLRRGRCKPPDNSKPKI